MEWKVYEWKSQKVGQKGEVLNRNNYKCGFCKGKGIISHNKAIRCPGCAGAGTVRIPGFVIICAYCNGDGRAHLNKNIPCSVCKGKGVVLIGSKDIVICTMCKGRGMERGSSLPCLKCKGKGVMVKKENIEEGGVLMVKKKAEKRPKEEEGIDLDFGIGKLTLGGLFNGIEKLVDVAAKLKEAGGEIKKEGEIDLSHLKEGMKGVFGFSIKTAVGGKPIVEPFGNIKKTPKGPTVDEVREPITDIFDEKEEIRIYAEIPGVNEGDIKIDLKGDILDIAVQAGNRKYHKEVLLPAKVKAETLTSSYKNGILEISIKK